MITLNQTPSDDNKIIYFYRLYLSDGNIAYFTSRLNGITLSHGGNDLTYDGTNIILSNDIIEESYDFTNGGTIGSVANITIGIPRSNSNSLFNSYHNEFYPNTNVHLYNGLCELGIGWEGITDYENITWLYEFYVQNVQLDYNFMNISLYSFDFYKEELPKHIIQNENAFANYYFPNAPEDNIGLALPLLYGNFKSTIFTLNRVNLAYTVCVDDVDFQFIYATHKCRETIYSDYSGTLTNYSTIPLITMKYIIFRYLDNAENYLEIYNSYNSDTDYNNLIVNNLSNSWIKILYHKRTYTLYGNIVLTKFKTHKESDLVLPPKFNTYGSTNSVIGIGEALIIKPNLELSESELGILAPANATMYLEVTYQSADGNNVNLYMRYYNDVNSTYSSDMNYNTTLTGGSYAVNRFWFGENTSAKTTTDLPFTIEELISYGFVINNSVDSSAVMNVKEACVKILAIVVSHVPSSSGTKNVRMNANVRAITKVRPR